MGRSRREDTDGSLVTPSVGLALQDPLSPSAGRAGGGLAYLLDALRTRPARRRLLTVLSIVLALTGAGMIAYP